MTRPIAEIEADVAAAQAAHQAAQEAHRQARQTAADLRRRAVNDDAAVTASDLAAADHESDFASLKIASRMASIEALEAEHRSATAEAFADEFVAAEQPLHEDFDQSLADLEAALNRVVTSWRSHATFIRDSYTTAAHMDRAATARIRFYQYGPYSATIDRTPLRALPVHQPLEALLNKALGALNARLKP
jgi:hypothetical protein